MNTNYSDLKIITIQKSWKAFLQTRLGRFLENYFGYDDLAGIILIIIGGLFYLENRPFPQSLFYDEIHSDLIVGGLTVLIIGNATQAVSIQAEKKRLILQMGSPDNGFAIEAVRQLRQRGWLFDGTLKDATLALAHLEGANLTLANLQGANLLLAHLKGADFWMANLEGANLMGAHLEKASLSLAHLEGANLTLANQQGANLMWAHLEESSLTSANLEGADLEGAHLEWAKYDENTIWKDAKYNTGPSGTKWLDETFDPEAEGCILVGDK